MPLTHVLATRLCQRLAETRAAKTQVTVEYENEDGLIIHKRVHTIVISAQHCEIVSNDFIRQELLEKIIKPVVPPEYIDERVIYHLNPSGRFVKGGPQGDARTAGRKTIVDTYGGW